MNTYDNYVQNRLRLPGLQEIFDSDVQFDSEKATDVLACTRFLKARDIVAKMPTKFKAVFDVWDMNGAFYGSKCDFSNDGQTQMIYARSDRDGTFGFTFYVRIRNGGDVPSALVQYEEVKQWFAESYRDSLHRQTIKVQCVPWITMVDPSMRSNLWKTYGRLSCIPLELSSGIYAKEDLSAFFAQLIKTVLSNGGSYAQLLHYRHNDKVPGLERHTSQDTADWSAEYGDGALFVVYEWDKHFDLTTYPSLHRDVDDSHRLVYAIVAEVFRYVYPTKDPKFVSMLGAPIGIHRKSLDKEVRRTLVEHMLPWAIVDWDKEPTCPWKGMKLFHGTFSQKIQTAADRRCQLRTPAFTTPYPNKAAFFAWGGETPSGHVLTYRLINDRPRMLDLRSHGGGLGSPELLRTSPKFPHAYMYDIAGIHLDSEVRVQAAKDLQDMFHKQGIDGVMFNSNSEWVWFEPDKFLEWEWAPSFTRALANLDHPRVAPREAFNRPAWQGVQERLVQYLRGRDIKSKRVDVLRVVGNSMVDQFTATIEDAAVEDASRFNVYEVDYYDMLRAVLPDAVDMFIAYATDSANSSRFLPDVFKTLVHAITSIRSTAIGSRYPLQLLVRLPNGRVQLLPPISEEGKKRLADATPKRLRTDSSSSSSFERIIRQRTSPGTSGRLRLVI